MVGRTGALARLVDLVDAAEVLDGDQPTVALIAGEPGIGKTRLLREFLDAIDPGVPTYVVAAEPGSMGRANAALSALGAIADGDDPARGLREAIERSLARSVVVLVVEDVHWLDAESAAAIDEIARQPWPNLVIVGTYRADDLSRGAPGGELVLRLERRHSVEQIRLDRLDRVEVGAMVAAIVRAQPSSAVVEAVARRSGGVPFVIEELMRCCEPGSFVDDVLTVALPWSLEEAVRQQLAGLDVDQRIVVEAIAVYGRAITFETLMEVAELDDSRALAALRPLIARSVVVESDDDRFWFVHALVADAVAGQLIGRERRRLHERCFDAERGRADADHATLARHAAGAGRFDEIVTIAREGAPAYLARGATFQALRLAADGLAEAPDDPLLLGVASEAAWRLDFDDEAIATSGRWAAVAETTSDRIEAERLHGRLHHEQGEHAGRLGAVKRLTAIADQLGDDPSNARDRAHAAAAIAQLLMLNGESAGAIEWADRAIADGVAAGDALAVARGKVERASALSSVVPLAESRAALDDAIAAARAVGDPVLESRALNNSFEVVPVHTDEGQRLLATLVETTCRSGLDKLGVGPALYWQAATASGNADMAGLRRALGDRARPTSVKLDHGALDAYLAYEEGRLDDAAAWSLASVDEEACTKEPLLGLALQIAAARGELEHARRAFDAAIALGPPPDTSFVFADVLGLIEGALAAEIPPAEIRERVVRGLVEPHPSADALLPAAEGLLALAEGRPDDAAASLAQTLAAPDERIPRPLLGALRTALATALLAIGDRAGAMAAVTEVLDGDLVRWPGVRRDRAEALARRLQGASSRSDGELTAREREVAALIAEGLTNGQLAERLYISPKTAAVHVSHILTKLGLSSRAEIAAWTVRNGIALAAAS
jgi:DNA-binding NarL/FixJ family response regulator